MKDWNFVLPSQFFQRGIGQVEVSIIIVKKHGSSHRSAKRRRKGEEEDVVHERWGDNSGPSSADEL